MTYDFNFCAPFIPNDPTINFHRYVQTLVLLFYLIFYICVHTYYKFFGPMPLTEEEREAREKQTPESQTETVKDVKKGKNQKKDDDQSSENSSNLDSEKDKEVSIKLQEQANDSCVELKKSGTTWQKTRKNGSSEGGDRQKNTVIIENVNINEVETYFPIVFGHFAIAMAASIMYSPYAEQSIASILYFVFTIPLLLANAKRMTRTTLAIWGFMIFFILFILTSSLLEVGQSNFDVVNLDCFANQYVSLYD